MEEVEEVSTNTEGEPCTVDVLVNKVDACASGTDNQKAKTSFTTLVPLGLVASTSLLPYDLKLQS